eukprot:m.29406 g.29406  ORF g.29406 m.29406 type:complete len:432 (+) comp31163_c0_seq2:147-1442(+)
MEKLRQLSISLGNTAKDIEKLSSVCAKEDGDVDALSVRTAINDKLIETFAETLKKIKTLTALNLDLPEVSDSGFTALAASLKDRPCPLRKLSISANQLSAEGVRAIAADLLPSPDLVKLDLYATQCDRHDLTFGDDGIKRITGVLKVCKKHMTYLGLRQNKVTDAGLVYLTDRLGKYFTVSSLNLQGNLITSAGVSHIAKVLRQGSHLTALSLEGNVAIGDEGAIILADALCSASGLRSLDLQHCSISDAGAMRFAEVLSRKENCSLTELILDGNPQLGDAAVELIARGLEENLTLTCLSLKSCRVGDEGTVHLARSLVRNKVLEHLMLDNNEIGDAGAIELADMLEKNRVLRHLHLTKTRIGIQGQSKLTRALKANSVILTISLTETSSRTEHLAVEGLLMKNREIRKLRQELEKVRSERDEALAKLASL